MKLTEFCLDNRTTTLVLTVVLIVAGLGAYKDMGRLEDPEFTIKDALVITQYPGATAEEVEEEVTDEIEIAVQQMAQLDEVTSVSYRGLSIVTATMKDKYDKTSLPQVWDELRRKVGDAQGRLPPGAGPSIVNDDFGDVYGIFFAVYGDEYEFDELWEVAKMLRRELLLVQDVAKIDIIGNRPEVIYVQARPRSHGATRDSGGGHRAGTAAAKPRDQFRRRQRRGRVHHDRTQRNGRIGRGSRRDSDFRIEQQCADLSPRCRHHRARLPRATE